MREEKFDDSQKRAAGAVMALVTACLVQLGVEGIAEFAL